MSSRTLTLTDPIYEYLLAVGSREGTVLQQLRQETAKLTMAEMQISPEQGQFMALLVQILGAEKTLEIGVFTGYSTLWVALALPSTSQIIACDINEQWTGIAQRYWQQAGVADKIQLRLAPALDTLQQLLHQGQGETFDFAFIDADKVNYQAYFELSLQLLKPSGLIAVDNVLWSGQVTDPQAQDENTLALKAFNQSLHQDQRIALSMLPIGDGLTLAYKKP